MRSMFTIILFVFFCFKYTQSQPNYTIRIDPESAIGGTASQIFDAVEFIPLQTTSESLFGSIDQMEVTDDYYFILDTRSRSILIFNRDGSLHTRIRSGGVDKYFGFFTLNRIDKKIIINNQFSNGLLIYDYNGKYIGKEPFPVDAKSLYYFGSNSVLYNLSRPFDTKQATKMPYDLAYGNGFYPIRKYVNPYNPKFENGEYNIEYNPFNYSGEIGSCMFSLPFDYKAYQLNDTGLINTYKFIFPLHYSLPVNFSTDSIFKGQRAKYVYSNRENVNKIYSVSNVYKIGDRLLFAAPTGQLRIGSDWNYLYNLKSGSLISFSRVTGDSTTFYFPILASLLEKVDAVNNGEIFSSFPSFRIFAIKNNIDKLVNYPPPLKKLLASGSKNDNPVIVKFRLKSNL